MDYKEKYEQAIEKLRNFYRDYDTVSCLIDVKEELANLFPELAESEDEKIRKRLITDFGTIGKKEWGGLEVKDILAWLEKQGEHANFRNKIQVGDKVTRNEDGVLVNLTQLKRVAKPSEKQGEKHPEPYNGISFEYNGHIWGMCARDNGVDISCDKHLIKHLEKQGEQKPAGKVELKFKVGDKIYLKPEYRMPDDDTPIANTVKEIRRVDDKHYRFDGAYIFIEDQDKYELVEQKPAWSEEDEQRLNSCLNILQPKTFVGNTETINTKWLKSLKDRVQPKQEWSEEDEQHIDSLLKRLDALCRNKFERTRFAISEDRDWLKSLRPQNMWKPSEDDIIILEKLIKGELEPKVFQATLHGILEQLKKLKEE